MTALMTTAIEAMGQKPTKHRTGESTMDKKHPDPAQPSQAPAIRLALTLLFGGSLHFLAPQFFDSIIPRRLPGTPRAYTYASGGTALGIGTGLSIARTRRVSAMLAGAFFIAVMPAKVQLAVSWCRGDSKRLPAKFIGIMQLFWQVP